MTDELKPCPFCGGNAKMTTRTDEDIWSHDQVEWTKVGCAGATPGFDCFEPSVEWPSEATDEDGVQMSISLWNRRVDQSARMQMRTAADQERG